MSYVIWIDEDFRLVQNESKAVIGKVFTDDHKFTGTWVTPRKGTAKADWDEDKHPRDHLGRFTFAGGGSAGAMETAHEQAKAHVLGQKDSAKREYGYAFDANGNKVGEWRGTGSRVLITGSAKTLPGSTFYHNHPDPGPSLSGADVDMAAAYGTRGVYAVTADGTTFGAVTVDLWNNSPDQKTHDTLTAMYSEAHQRARDQAESIVTYILNKANKEGNSKGEKLTKLDWARVQDHLVNRALAKTGLFRYTVATPGKDFRASLAALGRLVNADTLVATAAKYAGKSFTSLEKKAFFVAKK